MPTPKSYELMVEQRPSYLYAHVKSASVRPAMTSDYLKEIIEKCRETHCNRVVIDNDVPKAFWVWDIFPVSMRFPGIGRECTKVAVVDQFADPIENEEFSVLVGNKCGVDLHVFDNLAAAERWVVRE